jgi:hypothetical protein
MNDRKLNVRMAQNSAANRAARAALDVYAEADMPVIVPRRSASGGWTGKPPVSATAGSQEVAVNSTSTVTRAPINAGLMSRHKRQQQQQLRRADAPSAECDTTDSGASDRCRPPAVRCPPHRRCMLRGLRFPLHPWGG